MNKETKAFVEGLLEKYDNPVDLDSAITGGQYVNEVWYATEDIISMFIEITHSLNIGQEEK